MTEIKDFLIFDLWKIIINYVNGDIDVGLNLDEFDWKYLSSNSSAVYILEDESEKKSSRIYWMTLVKNRSPIAIQIIENNLHILNDTYDYDMDINAWEMLSTNPSAIDIVEKQLYKINLDIQSRNVSEIYRTEKKQELSYYFYNLCLNQSERAVSIIEKNMNTTSMQINWKNISENPSDKAIDLIEKNMNKIDWEALSSNTSHRAISILENNLDKIHWGRLSSNESAISLIEKYFADHKSTITLSNTIFCKSTLYWFNVCRNPGVINFLEKIMDNQPRIIDWKGLSMNKAAIHILEKNMDKVNWEYLSYNPKAIHILEQNMNKIDWVAVSCNRVFFKEYPTIKLKRLLNIV